MIGRRGGGSTRTVGANGADGRAPRRGPARISITTDAQRRCRLERVSARSAMRTEYATTVDSVIADGQRLERVVVLRALPLDRSPHPPGTEGVRILGNGEN